MKIFTLSSLLLFSITRICFSQCGPVPTLISSPPACPGQTVTYRINALSGVSQYSWLVASGSPNATISSQNGTSADISFTSSFTTCQIVVYGIYSSCGAGPALTFKLDAPTTSLPAAAPLPSGLTSIADGQTNVTYSVNTIQNATSYQWSLPAGATITSGSATRTISVNFAPCFLGGPIKVRGSNGCPGPYSPELIIGTTRPSTPSIPAGNVSVSPGQTSIPYSIPSIATASAYEWMIPANSTISSGSGTNRVLLNYNSSFTSGTLKVRATRGACVSDYSPTLSISRTPAPSGPVAGNTGVCVGVIVPLSVAPIQGATSYQWTPGGGPVSIVGNSSGNTIQLSIPSDFSSTAVTVTVRGVNSYGTGPSSPTHTITVYQKPPNPSTIAGPQKVFQGQSNVSYSTPALQYATTYIWNTSGGIAGSGASSSTNRSFTFSDQFINGQIYVSAINGPCATSTISINVEKTTPEEQTDKNFIATRIVTKTAVANEAAMKNLSENEMRMEVAYFDGLGRPMQTVQWKASPLKKDVVTPIAYDLLGRQAITFLQYVSNEISGYYKPDPVGGGINASNYSASPQASFYANDVTDLGKVVDDAKPFSVLKFEPSPLNRVIERGASGNLLQPDATDSYVSTDRTIKFDNITNSEAEVLNWSPVSPTSEVELGLITTGTPAPTYYAAGTLSKEKTKEQNGFELLVYRDRQGKVLLRRSQAVSGSPTINNSNYASTYYIYDNLGRLTCILPPEGSSRLTTEFFQAGATDQTRNDFLNKWAIRYVFDERGRTVIKQLPGIQAVYFVYDKRNRLVLSQDGIQRAKATKEWTFNKYDAFGRITATGKYSSNDSRSALKTNIDSFYGSLAPTNAWYDSYVGSAGSLMGYDNKSFPQITEANCLVINYYDIHDNLIAPSGYQYVSESLVDPETNLAQMSATEISAIGTFGQQTAKLRRNIASGSWLRSVYYYNQNYQVVQSINDYHKGSVTISTIYDFIGTNVYTKKKYTINSGTISIVENGYHDHMGRIMTLKHQINSESPVILFQNQYNELGQLIAKQQHSRNNGTSFAQKIDYRYDINQRVKTINSPNAPNAADHFNMSLEYETPSSNVAASDIQFTGGPSEIVWQSVGSDKQSYAFKYDPLNRLLESTYYNLSVPANNGRYTEKLTGTKYDLNGNIQGLARYGKRANGQFGITDDLTYIYSGNQLSRIDDSQNNFGFDDGFTNKIGTALEYTFDANGKLLSDANKAISVEYNDINLPQKVSKASDYLTYNYDATGAKLSQQVFGANPKTTDYIGDLVFENDALQYIAHSEGRIIPATASGTNSTYQYGIKDHLGSLRVLYNENTSTSQYSSDFETQTSDFSKFNNIGSLHEFDHTDLGTNFNRSHLLTGANAYKVGMAKSLLVQAGDVVDLEVYAKYSTIPSTNTNAGYLFTAISQAFGLGTGSSPIDGVAARDAVSSLFPNGTPFITSSKWENSAAPKAYLNYILFDENFALIDFGFDQVNVSAEQSLTPPITIVPHDLLSLHVKVKKKGYLYVYLSNENPTEVAVYFDDLKVTHKSAIEQLNEYYSFGLRTGSLSFDRLPDVNSILYTSQELQTELQVNTYDFGPRTYDPSIGRWSQSDPMLESSPIVSGYTYVQNNPMINIDPSGLLKKSTYVNSEGTVIAHYEDGDPLVYYVPDETKWDKRKHGLAIIGFEDPSVTYTKGNKYEHYYPQFKRLEATSPWPAAGSAVGALLLDDLFGVGVLDDIAIPVIVTGAIYYSITQADAPAIPIAITLPATQDRPGCVVIFIDGSTSPEAAQHAHDAITKKGIVNIGTLDRLGANARRQINLKLSGLKSNSINDRDEFVPALLIPMVPRVSVQYVELGDNRRAGNSIKTQLRGVPEGTRVIVVPINVPQK
jgi:RHS repeat-associated protein